MYTCRQGWVSTKYLSEQYSLSTIFFGGLLERTNEKQGVDLKYNDLLLCLVVGGCIQANRRGFVALCSSKKKKKKKKKKKQNKTRFPLKETLPRSSRQCAARSIGMQGPLFSLVKVPVAAADLDCKTF